MASVSFRKINSNSDSKSTNESEQYQVVIMYERRPRPEKPPTEETEIERKPPIHLRVMSKLRNCVIPKN
ncbi:hypothetical protein GWI33_009162 [Rhynchophorus ferrugineus]|uniref:Uncharacterized protein n=1 Tax=Rhynchophorus ferrugineus TaxID=354439 RepID=A0A834ICH8_RHYFE|nr:hypothetical protein GWI33_009162 [Rhynchophorus ferrugineus]